MNILMVLLDKPFPPDIRIRKESLALVNVGYRVYLLTILGNKQPRSNIFGNVKIIRIPPKSSFPFLLRYLIHFIQLPFLLPPFIIAHNVRIIHVHDLPYAVPVVFIGRMLRRNTVFDMHENSVGITAPYLKKRGIIGNILLSLLQMLEIVVCRLATRVIVVVEENKERLARMGVQHEKVMVISNTADVEQLGKFEQNYTRRGSDQKGFFVSYVGGFSFHRGLDTLVKAMPLILEKASNVHLLLIGDGEMKLTLEKMCNQLGVGKNVTFTGWVSFSKAMEYVRMSALGVIPYHSTLDTNNTVPHKLFQYMYFRKPVLVSDVRPLKRIVEATNCGFIFRAGDHVQLAEKALKAVVKRQELVILGENGRKAVLDTYNWDREKLKLLTMYDEITKASGE